jgi:hypothetical protein
MLLFSSLLGTKREALHFQRGIGEFLERKYLELENLDIEQHHGIVIVNLDIEQHPDFQFQYKNFYPIRNPQ